MSADPILKHFELEYSGSVDGVVPVYKYRALESGVRIVVAQIEGPLVNGFFCLATEAHDDDGLPHTLEHIIFMGSEDYPYKGVLDLLANRCFASGTNAWTDTDHTCYTMITAGSDGFLNLMPIYLDHILFPTIKESAYVTEVQHINEEGEDAGVVYCEMQACENTGETRTYVEMLREMYPGHCGYKSVTGGIMKNLRESTSHLKVKSYHREFYRPENLCIIVAGMVEPLDVLKTFLKFEEKIVRRPVDRPVYVRPWQSDVPPLSASVEKTIKYGCDEEELGMFTIAWRGPPAKDQLELAGLMILFEYLTDTAVSPIQRQFVELEDPYCNEVRYSIIENSSSCVYLHFENVPCEKIPEIRPRFDNIVRLVDLLQSLCETDSSIDMERMHSVIHRQLLNALSALEDHPHDTIAFHVIGEFLYGNSKEDMDIRLNNVATFRELDTKPASYWTTLIKKYFIDKNFVAIRGEPSGDLMREMGESEITRVMEQKEKLKPEGLADRQKLLELAIKENEIQPPVDMLTSVSVPEVSSIHFHSLRSSSNYAQDPSMPVCDKFPLDDVPVSFQLDDIKTNFVSISVVMDTSGISEELRRYLALYTEVIRESPIMRNGTLISHEDIIKELAADTVDNDTSIGVNGGRFGCGEFSTAVVLSLKVEMERYVKTVQWLHELMYDVQFDVERIKIIANKMSNDVARMKRCGSTVAVTLLSELTEMKGSNEYITSMLRQHKFLTEMVEKLNSDPSYASVVLEKLNELKKELTDPARLRVHMSAHVDRLVTQTGLSDAVSVWSNVFLPSAQQKYRVKSPLQRDCELQKPYPTQAGDSAHDNLIDSSLSLIIGVGAVESSYLYLTTPCLTEFRHADVPAIMVYIQYLTQLEGPMWKQIRGLGLSYHYSLSLKLDYGYLQFCLTRSSQIVDAYRQAKKIIEEHIGDSVEFDAVSIESCKSSLIFEIIEESKTCAHASRQSLLTYLRGIPHGYNRWIMERIPEVSVDDMRRVSKLYFSTLFSPTQSKLSLCTHPTKVDETCQDFKKEFGRDLTVVKSLEESYLVNM